ncbi:glutathione peroxidase [Parvibaculum lavamentivorans DS-1]|uniref:Glutathione peroxidase n=1 Tax=Parvibaculum lavamentivorans (strain DS-1 / DSM 13023 / NCIMB 13966) TaxID=402881 RepID=A7HVD0_PARL1|nr:glutathione peroxidase [Parvibaculum lavamentivorans]ABS63863.1 glutathione peroxidase [Parvibaculum lavamentivorans DS-1]
MTGKTAYDFDFLSLKGKPLPLADFAGHPLLIVNTASKCGFTRQYKELEALWQKYRDDGLVVLGVPSNDFANQEPGGAAEIASFCETNFGVDFPLTEKVAVKGRAAHPLFQWLAREGGFLSRPRWNFYKYVIGKDGKLVDWFASTTTPGSAKVERAIEKAVRG